MRRALLLVSLLAITIAAAARRTPATSAGAADPVPRAVADVPSPQSPPRAPNELGRVPVLEYHLIGERESRWSRNWRRFAQDLELLHARGYRPITIRQLVERRIDVAPGYSPVVITFDDASPGQFRYLPDGDTVRTDPTSAVGLWRAFAAKHPEWRGRGVFCVLSGADSGHAFFGDKGIQGQRTAWRFAKLRELVAEGHELCNHTLWHANLSRMSDAGVMEQVARAQLAVDSAVPGGYAMRTLALPLGVWPKNRGTLVRGQWSNPKTGVITRYNIDAVLMVAGGPARSPFDSAFDPLRIPRVQVFGEELERMLDDLDRRGARYVAGPKKR
jgi:peptidoglycan/xylan/chitin deacetylase (PgdA/CDA1 family)